MSVKVGVRVRPFNQRESDLGCKLCVDMIGNMTRLYDADDPEGGKHRDFTFDYSFWSHDEFEPDERGYFMYACFDEAPPAISTQTSSTSSSRSALKFSKTHGKAITAVSSPTARLARGSPTRWWVTAQIRYLLFDAGNRSDQLRVDFYSDRWQR